MPVNQSMMKDLKKRYGAKGGERAYYAIENKRKRKRKGSITEDAMKNWR